MDKAHFISDYAPSLSPYDMKDQFYQELQILMNSVTKIDALFLMGDFNARVSADYQT